MSETEMNNIRSARRFLLEHEDQKALDCYLAANKENKDNAEACYWVYTAFWQNCVNNQESNDKKWMAFSATSNELVKAVEQIAESEGLEEEKKYILTLFVGVYLPIVDYVVKTPIATPKERIERAVLTLYWTGNAIERLYGSDTDFMKLACKVWKEGVMLQQKFYAYSYNDNKVEDYVEKIKKVEPDYVIPKKAGCISLG